MTQSGVRQILLLVLVPIFLVACQAQDKKNEGSFLLLPSSQELNQNGYSSLNPSTIQRAFSPDSSPLPILFANSSHISETPDQESAQIVYQIDNSIEGVAETYTLKISESLIEISAKDEAGLFYAFVSLDQLLEDANDQNASLPIVDILDYPALSFRPIHWDVKHHMEKEEYYYELLDELARQKINGVIIEFEDKLKFERRPEVGSKDGFSIEQWKKLSDYAQERHINVNPLVQGLGHASFILKHDMNKHLRDDLESDWAFNPLDPLTYELQFDLYRDAMEATPHGKYLHVGGDEVETTGRGSNKSQLELNLIWLNKVTAFAEENGRIPIFWDDMPLKHAGVYRPMFDTQMPAAEVDKIWEENESKLTDFLDQFPKNLIYMRWNYSSPETYGNIKTMDWFSSKGLQVMGATAGQTRFKLMPQNESNIDPIRSFALSSIEKNYDGLLLTLWDDDSPHFELYKRGIAAFAEYTWAGDLRSKEDFKKAYRHRRFGYIVADDDYAFIDELEGPVSHWNNLLTKSESNRNALIKEDDPLRDGIIDLPNANSPGSWSDEYSERIATTQELLVQVGEVASQIERVKESALRNTYTLDVYDQVVELVNFSFDSFLSLNEYDSADSDAERSAAKNKIDELPAKFESMRTELEDTYSKTRVLTKPADYILDQDHHRHLANQSTSFDWQFFAEMSFLEKIRLHFDELSLPADSEVLDREIN